MNPKYQIFISSTYEDLKEEREQVLKAILRLGHIPIGMEMFNAANETQWEMIKRRIEESDYYIVIIAQRYGSIEEASGVGYTEKEYDYANSIGVPTLGFVLRKDASWPINKTDNDNKKQKLLKQFIGKVQRKMRADWSNKDELASVVSFALNEAITATPRVGWIRANQAVSSETINEITRLSKENADLRDELSRFQQSNQVTAPMPELALYVSASEGSHTWYRLKARRNETYADTLSPRAEKREIHGFWLKLVVKNTGTLATDFSIEVSCDKPILSDRDIEGFKNRNGPLSSSHNRSGWHTMQANLDSQSWSCKGDTYGLKPGQQFTFILPLTITPATTDFSTIIFKASLFPVTGKHIVQTHSLKDILVTSES